MYELIVRHLETVMCCKVPGTPMGQVAVHVAEHSGAESAVNGGVFAAPKKCNKFKVYLEGESFHRTFSTSKMYCKDNSGLISRSERDMRKCRSM